MPDPWIADLLRRLDRDQGQPPGRIRREQMITGRTPELGHFRPSGKIDQVGTRIASFSGIVCATPSLIRRSAPVSVRPSNVPART